jgi:Molybdopterin-binding domain of aldehyde dehydrogenase
VASPCSSPSRPIWRRSPKEGAVRVRRVVCAVDCGNVVNPDTVRAQIQSAIIFGVTAALYGEITLKDGRVEQTNFDTYQILRMNEAAGLALKCQLLLQLSLKEARSSTEKRGPSRAWSTPMSWDHVKSKFDRLTGPRLDKGLKAEISAAAQNITTIPVKDLTELLGRVSRPQEQ